jgi:hypothetical protein
MLNNIWKYKEIFRRLSSSFPAPVLPALLLGGSAGIISKQLWWANQFSPFDIIQPWFSMLIYNMGDAR